MGFARINSFFWGYFEMAQKAKNKFDHTYKNEEEPEIETNPDEYFELRTKRFELGVQTIVFSAMTLESLINDYSSIKLGQAFFEKHVDKLNTISKFVVVLQMRSKNIFPKNGQAYECLDYLFKIRNKLVHPKSKPMPFKNGEINWEMLEKMEESYLNDWRTTVDKCYSAILLCAETLHEINSEEDLFITFKSIVSIKSNSN